MRKYIEILIGILSLILGTFYHVNAQNNTLGIKFSEPEVVFEANGDRYVNFDISLKRLGTFTDNDGYESDYNILNILDITFDVDATAFSDTPTGNQFGQTGVFDFNFIPFQPLNTYYSKVTIGLIPGQVIHGKITYNSPTKPSRKALELNEGEYYLWGTVHWKLLPTATHYNIKAREDVKEAHINASGAYNFDDEWITLTFENPIISGDIPDNPLAGVDKPVIPADGEALAWLLEVCSPQKTVNYTVTRPATVDTCIWYLSSDQAGKNKVADVADFVVTEKGEKAQITWKKTTTRDSYWLQVYSQKGANKSDPVQKEIAVEGFPEIQLTDDLKCRQTQVAWTNPTGITAKLYNLDYTSASGSPFTLGESGDYHLVSYRSESATCKDTVDYTPAFLNPQISWLTEPKSSVGRGDKIEAQIHPDMNLPLGYTPKSTEYIWTKPAGVGKEVAYYHCTAEALSYSFEVKASVDGCVSNTLTAETTVLGGGILPNAFSESGMNIVCQNGGVLLSADPTGVTEPISYKWYIAGREDVVVSIEKTVWVNPTADTKYVLEVSDNVSLPGRDTVSITYKGAVKPSVISAGEDQGIVKGTYTLLAAQVLTRGTSDTYKWNWRPTDKLDAPGNSQLVQTATLLDDQEYAVFVVDGNGCMSEPDSINVKVYPDLADGGDQLPPVNPGEDFEIKLTPQKATLCKNNSVQLALVATGINLEGAVYSWSPTVGLDDPTVASPLLTVVDGVVSRDYVLTISKQNFTIARKVNVVVNEEEEAPALQLADNRMSCMGDVMEVTATGALVPDEYVWIVNGSQISNTGNSYTLVEAGEQKIKVYAKISGAACASDTIRLNKTIGHKVTFEGVTNEVLTCQEQAEIEFTTIQPADGAFRWVKPDKITVISSIDQKVNVGESGTYSLVGGTGDCSDTTKIEVTLNHAILVEGLNPVITSCTETADLTFTTTTATSFVWLDEKKEAISGSENQNPYTVAKAGDYHLALVAGDCKDTVDVTVMLSTQPLVTVEKHQTTCGTELAINGEVSLGTLYWSENSDGSVPVTDKVTGSDETKVFYVYAGLGECKSEFTQVTVAFGATPIVTALDTLSACGESLTLQASTTAGELKWLKKSGDNFIPQTILTVTGLSSTDYYVYAEDGACQSEKKKVVAKFRTQPTVIFDPLQTTCGVEYELQAKATEGQLHWLDAEKNPLASSVVPGEKGMSYDYYVYSQKENDATCRSKEEKVTVVFGVAPQLSVISPQTVCADGKDLVTLELKAETTGGDLIWKNDKKEIIGTTWQTAPANTTATYYVQANDNGCLSSEEKVVAKFGATPVVRVETLQTACGTQHELVAQTTAGELTWLKGIAKLPSTTVTKEMGDTYYVYALDQSCKSENIEVKVAFENQPVVNVVTPQTSCGKLIQLEASATGGELVWENDKGEELKLTQVEGNPGETAIYHVYARGNGCASARKTVEVKFGVAPEVIAKPEQTACEKKHTLQAIATAGELVWLDKDKTVLPSPVVEGEKGTSAVFYVYAKGTDCQSKEKKITVHFGHEPVVHVVALQTTCEEAIQLEASATSGILNWTDATGTMLETNLVTGARGESAYYFVTAVDGSCESLPERVEVRFGAKPEVLAEALQTTCGTEYTMVATATNGVLSWFAADGVSSIEPKVTESNTYYVQAQEGTCYSDKKEIIVKFGTAPVLQVVSPQTTCEQELVLKATTSGGNIVWTDKNGVTLPTPKVGANGEKNARYYVQAIDENGCQSIKQEVAVQFGRRPELQVEDFQTGCKGIVELAASASGGDVYWLKPDRKSPLASTIVDGSLGKNYYVFAKDAGCVSDTVAVNIGLNTAPVITVVSPQTTCEESLQLEASASAGKVVWTNDAGEEMTSPLAVKETADQAIYHVKAVDGECVGAIQDVVVKFGSIPEIRVETVQTSCDTVLKLQGTVSAGLLMWEDEKNQPLDSNVVHGKGSKIYYAYAHAGTGCESERVKVTAVFNTAPVVNVESIQTACGTEIDLEGQASGGKLIWKNSAGEELVNTHRKMEADKEEIYYVYAKDGACQSLEKTVQVIYNEQPELLVNKIQTSCGTSCQLEASTTGGNIFWVDKDLQPVPAIVTGKAGSKATYYVYVKDGDCPKSEYIEVTVNFGVQPKLTVDYEQYSCESVYQLKAATTGGTIVWKNNKHEELRSNTVELVAGEPNIFYVSVRDESCTPVVNLPEEKVTVTYSGKPELALSEVHCVGDELKVENALETGEVTYHWFVDGEKLAQTGNTHVFDAAGSYAVKVVGEALGGCISDTLKAQVEIAEPLLLGWEKQPAEEIAFGLNLNGCVKVISGKAGDVKNWNWISPVSSKPSGTCFNISAKEQDYVFKVYADDVHGCVSDTLTHKTKVTGFDVLDLVLESESGVEICAGGSGLLKATVNGGLPPYTYEWYVKDGVKPVRKIKTAAVVDVLTVQPEGVITYVVKVKDAKATPAAASDELTLALKNVEGGLPVADAGLDMTIKKGLHTLLKSGNNDVANWNWLPVNKLADTREAAKQFPLTTNLSTSQVYELFVTDHNGCISKPDTAIVYVLPLDGTEDGNLPKPPVTTGLYLAMTPEVDTICLGTERWISIKDMDRSLSGAQVYDWQSTEGLTLNTRKDSALFRPVTAGDYTFMVTVTDGKKRVALRSDIRVNDVHAPEFALQVSGDCQYDTVKLVYNEGSVAATKFEWRVKGTPVEAADAYYVLAKSGAYTVDVVAENSGCRSGRKSVNVNVNAAPEITDLILADSCARAVVGVKASGAMVYNWTSTRNGEEDPADPTRYVIPGSGAFEVTVKASNEKCSATRQLEGTVYSRPLLSEWVAEPMDANKNATIVAAVEVQEGTGTPGYTYHWMQPEKIEEQTGSYTLEQATLAGYTFQVYAADSKGCVSDTLAKAITVNGGDVKVEIRSVYGDEICKNGAAMLEAKAAGMTDGCIFEWTKTGVANYIRQAEQSGQRDTLWIKAADVAEYNVAIKDKGDGHVIAIGKISTLKVSGTKEAPVVTTEPLLTIQAGGSTILPAQVEQGTPGYNWHWSPAHRLMTLADSAKQYPQTRTLETGATYQVYVTDQNSCVSVPASTQVDIDNVNGICVEVQPQIAEVCRANQVELAAVVSCGKPTGWNLNYAWTAPDGTLNMTNKDSVVFTATQEGDFTAMVKVSNGKYVAVAAAQIKVADADAPVLALGGRWDCLYDTLRLENTGETAANYIWTVDEVVAIEKGEKYVLANKDIHQVEVYAESANGCRSDVIAQTMKLGIVPEVEIAGGAFVNYADSVNVVKLKQMEGLSADDYTFEWKSDPAGKVNGLSNQMAITTMPMAEDVKYTVVVTSKENEVCQASDTAWGYMIPKSATVEIDKDPNTGNIVLSWKKEQLGFADSVRIMNIKWDGYGVQFAYQPEKMVKADVEKYLVDVSKDTLEFFYINASRYIKDMGRSYYSLASDTVGYMRQWLYANAPGNIQYNYIAYPFDMSAKGINNKMDLIKFLGKNSDDLYAIYTLANYEPASDKWNILTMLANGASTGKDHELVPKEIYQVVLRKNETVDLLLFGKLPSVFSYDLSKDYKYNYVMTPLSFGYKTDRNSVGDVIDGVYTVGSFNFATQKWGLSTKLGNGAWTGTSGDFNLTVFRPLRVVVTTNIKWGY